MTLRFAPIALLVFAGSAHAGAFCDEADGDIKKLEAFAKDKAAGEDRFAFACASWQAAFRPRIEKACSKIIARDGATSFCWQTAASAGIGKLGSYDIFDWLSKFTENPLDWNSGGLSARQYKPDFFAAIGDPRGAALIIEEWKSTIPKAEIAETKKVGMVDWSSWRQSAARGLGVIGTATDIPFLEEQEKATKDRGVARACREAITAITKRTAKP